MAPGYAINSYPFGQNYYEMMQMANNPLYWGCLPGTTPTISSSNAATTTEKNPTGLVPSERTLELAENTESSGNGLKIAGLGGAIAATALIASAARKGGGIKPSQLEKGFGEIWTWTKGLWGDASSKAKGLLGKNNKFTFRKIGNAQVCTIPNRTNLIRGGQDAVTNLEAIGADTVVHKFTRTVNNVTSLGEGINLRKFDFTYQINGQPIMCHVNKGKLKFDYDGVLSESALKQIKDKVASYRKGENLNELTNIVYSHKADGVSRLFSKANIGADSQLLAAASDRFALASDAVGAYRFNNKNVDEALTNWANGQLDKLNVLRGEYSLGENIGTLIIENGKIKGIKIGNNLYDNSTNKYINLYRQYQTSIDDVLKNNPTLSNPIYTV